jgi:hypothetical protein
VSDDRALDDPGDGRGLRNQQPARNHAAGGSPAQACLRDIAHGVEAPDLVATQCEGFRFRSGYGLHAFHIAKEGWPVKAGNGVARAATSAEAL